MEAVKRVAPYIPLVIAYAVYEVGGKKAGDAVVGAFQKVGETAQRVVDGAVAGIEKGIETAIDAYKNPSTEPSEFPDTKWSESVDSDQEKTASSGAESGAKDSTENGEGAKSKIEEKASQVEGSETTNDSEIKAKERSLGEKWKDKQAHPEDWEMTGERPEDATGQSYKGDQVYEREYTNKNTGEKIYEQEIKDPTTGETTHGPHPRDYPK